jgi:NitT/TauT family transport system ATP-binding protein
VTGPFRTGATAKVLNDEGFELPGARVSVSKVWKRFDTRAGNVVALEDIDCEFPPESFVSILGPSGCGKSTLLRLIAGLIAPSAGTVAVDGNAVVGPPSSLGMVFQDDVLLEWRTVLQNVLLPVEVKRLNKVKSLERAQELLEQVGLGDFQNSRPSQLSGGMKQRAAICQALVQSPQLLLMDEPFGALDALTREQMQTDLQALWLRQRKTVIFVTHSISEAVFLSDRVIVMSPRPGRIAREIEVDLPRPRDERSKADPEYLRIVREIHEMFAAQGVLRG